MSDTEVQVPEKETNEQRKIKAINHRATKAHEWRVQVWAQMERKIRSLNAELAVLGADAFEPYEPQFDDDQMLAHYATMTLPK